MSAFVNRMTEAQVNDLITLAKELQLKAETSKDRDTAVMAYAVQQSCSELLSLREEHSASMDTITALMEILGTSDTPSISGQVAALKTQRDALAAENAGLKQSAPDLQTMMCALDAFFADEEVPERAMLAGYNILRGSVETPATDRFIADVKAQGADMVGEHLKKYAQGLHDDARLVLQDGGELCHGFAQQLRGEKAE